MTKSPSQVTSMQQAGGTFEGGQRDVQPLGNPQPVVHFGKDQYGVISGYASVLLRKTVNVQPQSM